MAKCAAISNPYSVWPPFCPNVGAAYLFTVLFGLTTVVHIAQMIYHRKPYCWTIVASGVFQTTAYAFRILSIENVSNTNDYTIWFVVMMVAPLLTNAYAYTVTGRMVYNFSAEASVFKIKAWRFGLIFVSLDVVALLVQLGGAAVASQSQNLNTALTGLRVYMGGCGLQEICILLFLLLTTRLHKKLLAQQTSGRRRAAMTLLYVEYAVVTLITVRIIFRLVEYSSGLNSKIASHEAYQYVLDSTLMLAASVLLNLFHPGRLMPGKESDLPSRKERNQLKKQGLRPQGRAANDDYSKFYPSQDQTSLDSITPEQSTCYISDAAYRNTAADGQDAKLEAHEQV